MTISEDHIQKIIYNIRNKQVMLDSDLATLYQVETRILNQAVKRNINRFPPEFMFQLTKVEFEKIKNSISESHNTLSNSAFLTSQNVTLKNKRGKHRKYLPFVFTEQGVSMLSAVLKSDVAVEISIKIINAFVNMRRFLTANAALFQKFDLIEQKILQHDKNFEKIFKAIESKDIKPKQGIFYNGQIFDSYLFLSKLIKNANKSIILIDNYIDETVLTLFSKNQNIDITIFTKNFSRQLELDLRKYNAQYRRIEIKKFTLAHDRFLIIDEKEIYHFGASLKDLGNKWFAFTKFNMKAINMLSKLGINKN
jgi:ORF6N domain